jgi:predicted nucleic acid-binding protein
VRPSMATQWKQRRGAFCNPRSRVNLGSQPATSTTGSMIVSPRLAALTSNSLRATLGVKRRGSTNVRPRHKHPVRNDAPYPCVRGGRLDGRTGREPSVHNFVSQAEILSGLANMADGRRRRDLERTAREMFEEFEGRVLPFDTDAAATYAELYAMRRQAGRPGAPLDLMIASIARSHGANMVTRNVGDFDSCGLTIINPWEAS